MITKGHKNTDKITRHKKIPVTSNKKLKNITLFILENMLDLAEDIGRLSMDRKEIYRVLNQNRQYEWNDSVIGRWLQNLKQRDLITIEKKYSSNSIILTNKAKIKLVDKLAARQRKDDVYRFITFDIPEKLSYNRNKFRSILKKIGFIQIQKSLWVIDKDVSNLVELAMLECGVERYVAYIVSSKSDIDGLIKKKFEAI